MFIVFFTKIYFIQCIQLGKVDCYNIIRKSNLLIYKIKYYMAEQNLIKAKKSSRLNPKKEQKLQIQVDSSWKQGTINVALQYDDRMQDPPKILKDFVVYYTAQGGLVTKYLIEQLKNQKVIRQFSSLSFYNQSKKVYIYALTVPLNSEQIPSDSQIDQKFIYKDTIKIKVRAKKKIAIDALIEEQRQKYDQVEDQKNTKGQKQKKIGEVVEKVALWRKFYTGFYDQDGNYFQKPLQSAAQEVGIAKKTLDDYLLQIRNGKKYGFNFNEKFNNKIGELRAFVRDEKKKAQQK